MWLRHSRFSDGAMIKWRRQRESMIDTDALWEISSAGALFVNTYQSGAAFDDARGHLMSITDLDSFCIMATVWKWT